MGAVTKSRVLRKFSVHIILLPASNFCIGDSACPLLARQKGIRGDTLENEVSSLFSCTEIALTDLGSVELDKINQNYQTPLITLAAEVINIFIDCFIMLP